MNIIEKRFGVQKMDAVEIQSFTKFEVLVILVLCQKAKKKGCLAPTSLHFPQCKVEVLILNHAQSPTCRFPYFQP